MTSQSPPVSGKPAQPSPADKRLQSLAIFVELEKRIRTCQDKQSLCFTVVNETHSLCPYRQAILWQSNGGINGQILAVSGLATPEPSAPFASWTRRLATSLAAGQPQLAEIKPSEVPGDINREWEQWLPAHVLWVPLQQGAQGESTVLLLARDTPWQESDKALLTYLAGTISHAWSALEKTRAKTRFKWPQNRRSWLIAAAVIVGISLIPVTQTTLAPAEIIASDPFVIRAGIDGVIDRIHVEPNQAVSSDELLVSMDGTRLRNQLDIAQKALQVADAEFRQAQQQGLFDSRANASLAILQGRVEQRQAEASYLTELLTRLEIRAPRAGVMIFDDADEWEGRPVSIGERIMMLADPLAIELEVRVPVSDVIATENGARVRMFLNTRPHSPLDAELTFASYQAELTPEGILAYRMVARFEDIHTEARIGLKGTAKLYGNRTLLIMYLLRRPLTSLRQLIGI
ncbi:MAG: HlyD family efflux transporter periplasmic adaptor subunit [Pseudohongiella sp.]|nr:HlyD family efflux transporter periplasmic adaptor subunit [Pseudohongiella sp.]